MDGNGRMLSPGKVRNCVFETASEIGVLCRAPVPRPPRRVYGQLLQIGKPAILRDSGYLTRRQNGKLACQVDRLCAL